MTAPELGQGPHELAMSDQLRAVVDEQAQVAVDAQGQPTQSGVYNATMGGLLADRIGDRHIGPEEYALELSYLCDDARRGHSDYTQQPMPAAVSGYDTRPFVSTAIGFARKAFGDEFGDKLIELHFGKDYLDQVNRDRAEIARLKQQG